jgi:phenylalanyl-tRNA synthetase beta chain
VYRPKQAVAGLSVGEKSLAVRLTLQDDASTLTETQIEAAVAAVVTQVQKDLAARLRA